MGDINQYLFNCVKNSDILCLREALRRGVNPNIHNNDDGYTLLIQATYVGCLEIVKELIKYRANPNLQDENGYTALLYATENEDLEIVKELLKAGANPNFQNEDGDTALHFASYENENLDIVKELLKAGANPRLKNNNRLTAYDITENQQIRNLLGFYINKYYLSHNMKRDTAKKILRTRTKHDIQLRNNTFSDETTNKIAGYLYFGKKKSNKISKTLKDKAKKLKIKLTTKRKKPDGSYKRVYKSKQLIEKQIKNKSKK